MLSDCCDRSLKLEFDSVDLDKLKEGKIQKQILVLFDIGLSDFTFPTSVRVGEHKAWSSVVTRDFVQSYRK